MFNQNSSPMPMPRQRPEGWPVGSFDSYIEAQAAVDMLSDRGDFPVNDLTIVGVNLMEVERVMGRLTWGTVLLKGCVSGAWLGIFFSIFVSLFMHDASFVSLLAQGIILGIVFGVISQSFSYALSRGKRDFSSRTEIVAGRYDVLCNPATAPRARDLIADYIAKNPRNN